MRLNGGNGENKFIRSSGGTYDAEYLTTGRAKTFCLHWVNLNG
jgi:hypothetical protein